MQPDPCRFLVLGDCGKERQWQALAQKGRLKLKTTRLATVVKDISEFLMPAVTAAGHEQAL